MFFHGFSLSPINAFLNWRQSLQAHQQTTLEANFTKKVPVKNTSKTQEESFARFVWAFYRTVVQLCEYSEGERGGEGCYEIRLKYVVDDRGTGEE